MQHIFLRKAQEKDAPAVLSITRLAFQQYAKAVGTQEKIEALKETLENVEHDIKHKHVYVCEIDGEIVGSVRFEVLKEGIAYLTRFSIGPDAQNLGIGGLLLKKVQLECYALGARAITLYTASKMRSSVSFYLKNGYYIHSIEKGTDYIRAFMVNELVEMDEMFDYERIVKSRPH
jgi:predicted N-acetyltransferase YhbS